MDNNHSKIPLFWCVSEICGDNKSLASGLIHPNSTSLLFVSDSFFQCLIMAFQKMPENLGGKRPIFKKSLAIQKISTDTLVRLLSHESELSADCYDDDHGSTFRARYAGSLVAIWLTILASGKNLDFRKPDCGVKSTEVRKCLR